MIDEVPIINKGPTACSINSGRDVNLISYFFGIIVCLTPKNEEAISIPAAASSSLIN